MMRLIHTLRFILSHPLNDSPKWKWASLKRYIRWQISSRLSLGPTVVPLVNSTHLIVTSGMSGATGNIYAGLHEFADCAFLLHLLRPSDLFVDVGANVGVYTLLASCAVGSHAVSIEPIPSSFAKLNANIRINDIADRVTTYNIGLGSASGILRFTTDIDTCNHVVTDPTYCGSSIEVPVRSLDEILAGETPTLIKIDVEGWESQVLAGAQATLAQPTLLALIVEMNGQEDKLTLNEKAVHDCLIHNGFKPYAYAPLTRTLIPLESKNHDESNTIYIGNLKVVEDRILFAKPFRVNGREI